MTKINSIGIKPSLPTLRARATTNIPTLPASAIPKLTGLSSIDSTELGKDQLKPVMTDLLGKQGITAGNILLDNTAKVRLLSAQPSFIERAAGTSLEEALKSLDLALYTAPPKDGKQDIYILGVNKPRPAAANNAAANKSPDITGKNIAPVFTLDRENGGHTSSVHSVAWSPDGIFLATAGLEGKVNVINMRNKKVVFTLYEDYGHLYGVNCVAWSPDGNFAATGGNDKKVKITDMRTKSVVFSLDGKNSHREYVYSVAWSPDGIFLATGSFDNTVKIINTRTKRVVFIFDEHRASVVSVSWSPDGNLLATASSDGTAKLIDPKAKEVVFTFDNNGDPVTCAAWSPDGRSLAYGSGKGSVIFLDTQLRKVVSAIALEINNDNSRPAINAIAWSPDGKYFAVACKDGSVKIFDYLTKEKLITLGKYIGAFNMDMRTVAWSPDGKFLATGSNDTTVKIYDFQEILAAGGDESSAVPSWLPLNQSEMDGLRRTAEKLASAKIVVPYINPSGQVVNELFDSATYLRQIFQLLSRDLPNGKLKGAIDLCLSQMEMDFNKNANKALELFDILIRYFPTADRTKIKW